jgi:hypothetical protein
VTPLGLPVVPEVNAMRMTASGAMRYGVSGGGSVGPCISSSSETVSASPPPSTSTALRPVSFGRSDRTMST